MARTPRGQTRSEFGPTVSGTYEFPGTVWQSLGPQPIQSLALPNRAWGNVSGRVSALALHPGDSSTILLGSATGGIWKSTDAGHSWRPVSDTAPALAISSIAYSPSNPSIVYAATGELDNAGAESSSASSLGTYLGAGILRSTDGGETWFRSDVNLPPDAVFARVLAHPTNPQSVLVAIYTYFGVPSGYYFGGIGRSNDGGVHFFPTMSHLVTDMVQDPNDPNTVYFAAANANCNGCPKGGVWVSHDFGLTWLEMFTNSSPVRFVKLGVSRVTPTAIYASFLNADRQHTGTGGIFRSLDAGAHWSQVSADPTMCPAPPATNQCTYDHWIQPDPTDPQTVYFGSIDLYKSVTGGDGWEKLTRNYNSLGIAVSVHPDQHAVAIDPSSPATIFFGNDGGVYRTSDGGATFQNLNATLALSQFNSIVPHHFKANEAIGGTQDNGNVRFKGRPLWQDETSGDGGFNLMRRGSLSPDESLVGHYGGWMELSYDGGATYEDVTACRILYDCENNKPLPSDPMTFYPPAIAAPDAPNTVFFGTSRVWTNTTFGEEPFDWRPLSAASISSGVLTALATVGDGSGAFWAGSRKGEVLFSNDGGATFSLRTAGLPAAVVTKIVAVSPDGLSAYVTFGGFMGSPSRHVFQTSDAGLTWTNVSGDLPDVPVMALAVDPGDPANLFVGTDVGVFHSLNGGANWMSFNQGLPNASIYDLTFSPTTGDLWAATYGRGVYRIPNKGAPTGPCAADANTLCLGGGRFQVRVAWRVPSRGTSGTGAAVRLTGDSGYFWFFSSSNVELVVKVLDGRAINGEFWVFYGALSDVEYTLVVTDTGTGLVRTYVNPSGNLASVADTSAFPGAASLATVVPLSVGSVSTALRPEAVEACDPGSTTLCLNAARFRVQVDWVSPTAAGAGTAVPLSSDTGYFWFFSDGNAELIIKVLDGRGINGKFWVFYGALSNVQYTITVTDTQTGAVRTYWNPQGWLASIADTSAF
jgi:photosystem II stability/assembly factor-like uncharacterized protein